MAASSSAECWLGGDDLAVEGTFTWLDGTPFDYTNWLGVNPDNFNGNQVCVGGSGH